jgi:hypothetical protein
MAAVTNNGKNPAYTGTFAPVTSFPGALIGSPSSLVSFPKGLGVATTTLPPVTTPISQPRSTGTTTYGGPTTTGPPSRSTTTLAHPTTTRPTTATTKPLFPPVSVTSPPG